MGFNPASPKSIGIALSEQGIITSFSSKGNMETGEEALLPYVDESPIAEFTLKYRAKHTLYGTFIKPFLNRDRIYPKYHIVRTGRFAGSKPNPQNIPEDIRDQYLPDEGEFFWDADAHQIEPLIQAHLSEDKQLLEDCLTGDVYTPFATAFNIQRYTAKQVWLATSYSAGEDMIVETSHRHGDSMTFTQAQTLYNGLRSRYKRRFEWEEEMKYEASNKGYVTTMFGRKRTLESMAEDESNDYDPLLKVVNSIVQGTAADILKLAMLRLKEQKTATTIHDEILQSVLKVPDVHLLDNLCPIMLKWDVSTGDSWGNLTTLPII
jgi:DNA polymerase-1